MSLLRAYQDENERGVKMDYHFTRGKFTEAELEKAIIELCEQQGYTYVCGEDMHRKYEDILLLNDLRSYLTSRYIGLSDTEMQKIINKLSLINATPLYLGNREAFRLVNEGFDLARDDISQVALHIDYINYDEPDKNIFKVVNQYSVQGEHLRRPDMLLFINGIPVAIFEFKTAIEEDTTIYDAWKQITIRYCRDIPKLMKYCFLSVISDGANTRMGSIFTPYEYYYAWNKANDTDTVANGISSLFTMIEGAFAKDRVVALLRDFVFYPDDSPKNEAIVCRYPQFFGAIKMLDNIKLHLRPEGDGKGGTYFGATGCGKTYTMLFLSRLITQRDNDTFNNPTIVADAVISLSKYYYQKVESSVSDDEIYDEVFSDNCKKALSFYTAYDEIASVDHCVECGRLCYYLEDYSSAIEYLSRANDKECQNILGIIYEKGLGCAVDRQTALSYYSNAKEMGSSAGAANYDRLSEIIAEENRRNVASTSTSYSSYSYYSYYSSYYSGYSSSSSGCVIEGTKILTGNGTECNIEDIKAHQEIRNCKGSVSYTSDELIKNDTVETLYAVNDDAPFMSLEHAILTERGWCSMNPTLSMSINPNFLVYQLEIGDVFYKKVSVNGRITDMRCEITRINVSPNTVKKPCYDLHFFDGFNSYYANGYPCLLNYPEFTLSSLKRQLAMMHVEQYNKFLNMCIENRDVLENIFGKTNIGFLFSDAIDDR